MGFFTRNTMSLEQMTHLVTYVAASTIGFYNKQGARVDEEFRQKLVTAWLQENGHAASHWKLTKLALTADGVARKLLHDIPELFDDFPPPDKEEQKEMYDLVFAYSHKALLFKGLTN
jgi:hypothetical protein